MGDHAKHEKRGDAGGLALVDSLNALRQMIDANRCGSVDGLVSATAEALMQHQEFDGCVVVIGGDAATPQMPSSGQRTAVCIPGFVDAAISSEVIPMVVGQGLVFFEPRLADHIAEGYGSLLGVPASDGTNVLGGLIVWNQDTDVLMPWHQNLLEMLAEVFMMILARLATANGDTSYSLDKPLFTMLAAGTGSYDRYPINGLAGMDRLSDHDDHPSFERSLEDIAMTPANGPRARYILVVDIDRFRFVREFGGEMTAERAIRVLSGLLRREMAGEKLIGRLGMDQFGIVVERRLQEQAIQLAESFIAVVDALRLSFSGQRYDVSISIGVAELKNGSGSGVAGLQRARQACQAAKKQGGRAVLSYNDDPAQLRRSSSEGRLLNRLTRALKDDDLELYAQLIAPLEETATRAGAPRCMHEILLRMRDDQGNLIGASAFLTVAERYGLSVKLDQWMIRRAFREIAASRFADDPGHRFTLNLSGHSINDDRLLAFIVKQFEQSGLPPRQICFEITETAAISDIGAAIEFVEELKKLGCEFALDDFGSGYSSFLYLRDLPVDYLKIDGELVRKIVDDPVSLALVRTIEGVAQLMGRQTIAEFVESKAILDAITEIGCNYAQGYLMGCPVPLADVLVGDGQ